MNQQARDLLARVVAFGVHATLVARALRRDVTGDHVARQLARSATSIGANYAEACEAESRHDFIHKMKICLKELRESQVWVQTASGLTRSVDAQRLAAECNELVAIFVASVRTAKANNRAAKSNRTVEQSHNREIEQSINRVID